MKRTDPLPSDHVIRWCLAHKATRAYAYWYGDIEGDSWARHLADTTSRFIVKDGFWYCDDERQFQYLMREFERRGYRLVECKKKKDVLGAREAVADLQGQAENSFRAWARENLILKHRKTLRYEPFVTNHVQDRLEEIVDRQLEERGYVRVIILKARQEGVSSWVQGYGFRKTLEMEGVEGQAWAQNDEAADAIFRRTKTFRERCEHKRDVVRNNKKEIQYAEPHNSALRVMVAGDEGKGRGDTIQFLHLTELAHWKEHCQASVLAGLLNAVHEVPGTFVFVESTANGVGDEFHRMWEDAVHGRSDYEPVFFSWGDDPGYRIEGVSPDGPEFKGAPASWRKDEARLRGLGYDDEQLAFRLRRIATKCQGSPEIFSQEMPATPEEAFISTGAPVFPTELVEENRRAAVDAERLNPAARYVLATDPEPQWEMTEGGPLRVWKLPERGRTYFITADLASGKEVDTTKSGSDRRDFSTFGVVDWERAEEVAVWHGQNDPDLVAHEAEHAGRWYNWAAITAESNNIYGRMFCHELLRREYPHVLWRENVDRAIVRPVRVDGPQHYTEMGFYTTKMSKALAVDLLNRRIRDGTWWSPEPEFWQECRTYLRDSRGRTNARVGCHDDRVIRAAIAAFVLEYHPPPEAPKRMGPPKPYTMDWFREELQAQKRDPKGLVL